MTVRKLFLDQMKKNGEVYAAAYYILASIILAVSAHNLGKIFDNLAGLIWLIADITVLFLRFAGIGSTIRPIIIFGASALGLSFFLFGSITREFSNITNFESVIAPLFRLFANSGLWLTSIAGFMKVSKFETPQFCNRITDHIGTLYLTFNSMLLLYAMIEFIYHTKIAEFGYIIATLLWILASLALRIKFDAKEYVDE